MGGLNLYNRRSFWEALFFEQDGAMNLSQMFASFFMLVGCFGFVWVVAIGPVLGYLQNIPMQLAAWSFIAGAMSAVLIAAIPISKAKILANATLPGDLAGKIASIKNVEASTDMSEQTNTIG